jgi:hypothetical protein
VGRKASLFRVLTRRSGVGRDVHAVDPVVVAVTLNPLQLSASFPKQGAELPEYTLPFVLKELAGIGCCSIDDIDDIDDEILHFGLPVTG